MIYIIIVSRFDSKIADITSTLEELYYQMFSDYEISFIYDEDGLNSIPDNRLVIISGSRFSVNDPNQWIMSISNFIKSRNYKKLLGICFGAQLIAKTFGAQVVMSSIGWSLGVHDVNFSNNQHHIPFSAIFNHKEIILEPPPEINIICSSANVPVAGFSINQDILGVQFHPEFNQNVQGAIMNYNELDTVDINNALDSYQEYSSVAPQGFIKKWLFEDKVKVDAS